MTVCTASMFVWNYSNNPNELELGSAIVAACERMLTDTGLDIEFQASRGKWAPFGQRRLVLVAGAMVVHSEIIRRLNIRVTAEPPANTAELAELVAQEFHKYRRTEAVRLHLTPLGLDAESFLVRQRTMEPALVVDLANQLQNYRIDAEALVLGCDGDKDASMYRVDAYGIVTNHSDIGFVSIGNGGIHSSAHFMFEAYTHATMYYRQLYQTFKAKKRAEVAPGVGEFTEMFLITRNGASPVPANVIRELEELHAEDLKRAKKRPEEVEARLSKLHNQLPAQPSGMVPDDNLQSN